MKNLAAFITAAVIAASVMLVTGCAPEGGIPEDFAFSVSSSVQGRIVEYHSEGNLLVKTNTAADSEKYTAELVLSDSERKTVYDLFSMMNLADYPDAPEAYDPGAPHVVDPAADIRLWVRINGEEKMIFADDISMRGNPSTTDGIAFMNTVEILLKMITGTEEYLSMPD